MEKIINNIDNWTLIQLFGGIAVVVSAIVTFIGIILKDYLNSKFDKLKLKELEDLKHKYTKTENLIENLSSSISQIHIASNSIIIESYQHVWNSMLDIRRTFPPIASLAYSILTPEEFRNIGKTSPPKFADESLCNDFDEFFRKHNNIVNNAESYRPFVGILGWNIFFAYQAFHGRLAYLYKKGIEHNKFELWYEDTKFTNQVLSIAIDNEAIKKLIDNNFTAFQNIRSYLEIKMQEVINSHIYGKRFTNEILTQSIALSKSISASLI